MSVDWLVPILSPIDGCSIGRVVMSIQFIRLLLFAFQRIFLVCNKFGVINEMLKYLNI